MKKIKSFLRGFIIQLFSTELSSILMYGSQFLIFMSGLFYIMELIPFIKMAGGPDSTYLWIMVQLQLAIVFICSSYIVSFLCGHMSLKKIMYNGESYLSMFSRDKNKYRIYSNTDKNHIKLQYNIFGDTWIFIDETHFCNNGEPHRKAKNPVYALHEKYNIRAGRTPICPHPFSDDAKQIPYFCHNNEGEYNPIKYFKTEEAAKYFLDCAITYLNADYGYYSYTNNE